MSRKRICTRKVDDLEIFSVYLTASLRGSYGFARPVARVLMQSRQSIKDGALADVRIAGKKYGKRLIGFISLLHSPPPA